MSPEELALQVSAQVADILKEKGVGDDSPVSTLQQVLQRNQAVSSMMYQSLYQVIASGLALALKSPICENCIEGRCCRLQMGLTVSEDGKTTKNLCMPCGKGAEILAAAILGKPSCRGYKATKKEDSL